MKLTKLGGLLMTLLLVVGCQPAETKKPADGAAAPAESSQPASDEGASTGTAQQEDVAASEVSAPTAPAVEDEAYDDTNADVDDQLAADDAGAEEESAEEAGPPTRKDYEQQLMAAMQAQDMAKGLEVVEAALVDFPDDVGMQVNRFLLYMFQDAEAEKTDPELAAQQFLRTAALARGLSDIKDQIPARIQQQLAFAIYNEARSHARSGNVDETLKSLREAADGGIVMLEFADDDFFAPVRDDEQFKAAIQQMLKDNAQQLIAEHEPFEFDFELPGLDENTVKLADYKGKVVIVDVWGTWCPPCKEEIPHFIKLQEAYPEDLAVVGINYEDGEPEQVVETIRTFAQDNGINYTLAIGDPETQAKIPNFRGFPTTLFVDRTGKVRLMVVGLHPYEQLAAYVDVLMNEEAAEDSAG